MDVLKPPTVWIGGSCYRRNPGDETKESDGKGLTGNSPALKKIINAFLLLDLLIGDTKDAYEEETYDMDEEEYLNENEPKVEEVEPGVR